MARLARKTFTRDIYAQGYNRILQKSMFKDVTKNSQQQPDSAINSSAVAGYQDAPKVEEVISFRAVVDPISTVASGTITLDTELNEAPFLLAYVLATEDGETYIQPTGSASFIEDPDFGAFPEAEVSALASTSEITYYITASGSAPLEWVYEIYLLKNTKSGGIDTKRR